MSKVLVLYRFYMKEGSKRFFISIGILATMLLFLYGYYLNFSGVDTFRGYLDYSYKYVVPIMCFIFYILFQSKRGDEMFDLLPIKTHHKFIAKLFVIKTLSIGAACIQLLFLFIHYFAYGSFSYNYILALCIEILVEYGVFLSFSAMVSYFLSHYIKKEVSLGFSLLYFGVIFSFIRMESKFFSNYFISKIDAVFIFNKIIICLAILCMVLVILYTKHKKSMYYLGFIMLTVLFLALSVGRYIDIYPRLNQGAVSSVIENRVVAEAYNMKINLCENFENRCLIKIKNNSKSPIKKADLMLSSIFKVRGVSSKKEILKFSHKNNLIRINLREEVAPGDSTVIEVIYGGDINIFNRENGLVAYSRLNGTYLNSNTLNWFPSSMDKSKKVYKVSLNKKVYSNNLTLSKDFLIDGVNLFILEGDISKKIINSVNVIGPVEYINNPKNRYLSHIENTNGRNTIYVVPSIMKNNRVKLNSNSYFININSIKE
ncbi:MAG: hypothetical protein RR840_07200 [Clostridium sp.]